MKTTDDIKTKYDLLEAHKHIIKTMYLLYGVKFWECRKNSLWYSLFQKTAEKYGCVDYDEFYSLTVKRLGHWRGEAIARQYFDKNDVFTQKGIDWISND